MAENCLQCGKKLTHIPGRRQKEFCNNTCRSNHWNKIKREASNINTITHSERPADPHTGTKYKKTAKTQAEPQNAPESPEIKPKTPPAGLKGIDLAIWKAENA